MVGVKQRIGNPHIGTFCLLTPPLMDDPEARLDSATDLSLVI